MDEEEVIVDEEGEEVQDDEGDREEEEIQVASGDEEENDFDFKWQGEPKAEPASEINFSFQNGHQSNVDSVNDLHGSKQHHQQKNERMLVSSVDQSRQVEVNPSKSKCNSSSSNIASTEFNKPAEMQDQQEEGANIIVIHPGPFHIVLGRASDGLPIVERHVIAYRKHTRQQYDKQESQHDDPGFEASSIFENRYEKDESLKNAALEDMRKELSIIRDARGRILPGKNTFLPDERLQDPRVRTNVQNIPVQNDPEGVFEDITNAKTRYVTGIQATQIPKSSGFLLFYPMMASGQLDCRIRSQSAVEDSIATIWEDLLIRYFSISKCDLKKMRVVILVSDLAPRCIIRSFTRIAVELLGFSAVLFHHNSVCATFGAGLPGACVVNVQATSTEISCVHDGISLPEARIGLPYGLLDVMQTLAWFICSVVFSKGDVPFSLENLHEMESLLRFHDENAHFSLPEATEKTYTLAIRYPCENTRQFHIRLAQHVVFAPYSLFFPAVFGLSSAAYPAPIPSDECAIEDALINDHKPWLSNTDGTPSGVSTYPDPPSPPKRPKGHRQSIRSASGSPSPHLGSTEQSRSQTPVSFGTNGHLRNPSPNLGFLADDGSLLPLDKAITRSIFSIANPNIRQKMYQAIILTGGGARYRKFAQVLQQRLFMDVPESVKRFVEDIVVLDKAKDIDSAHLVWKGGAVLSQLSTADDCWIDCELWERYGVRALRETVPFEW